MFNSKCAGVGRRGWQALSRGELTSEDKLIQIGIRGQGTPTRVPGYRRPYDLGRKCNNKGPGPFPRPVVPHTRVGWVTQGSSAAARSGSTSVRS